MRNEESIIEVHVDSAHVRTRNTYPNTLKGKAANLIDALDENGDYPLAGKDTLIDLNGDKYKDILIEFYGLAGTGLKNGVDIYLFNHRKKEFLKEPIDLPNPTFNFNNSTVVSYYIGNGGGYASKLKWNVLKLDTLESIEVNNDWRGNDLRSTSIVYEHRTGKTTKKTSKMVWLPASYRYFDYQPIIKRESP